MRAPEWTAEWFWGMKNIILVVVLQTILVAGVGAGGWFLGKASAVCATAEGGEGGGEAGEGAARQEPIFTELDALVMNIVDGERRRFMQVQITTKCFEQDAVDAIEKYSPRIRGELLDAFSNFTADQAASPEGREAMANKARETLNMVLAEEADITDGVIEVYLPKLVIQ